MKTTLLSLICLILAVFPALAQDNGQRYVTNIPDIPVIEGGIEMQTDGFLFDTPDGRVVESVVFLPENSSRTAQKQLKDYYADVLPQLGWVAQKTGVFIRDGEQLTVKIEKFEDGYIVVFDLSPESD